MKNSGGNVTITAQGNKKALENFLGRLAALFDIKHYNETEIPEAKPFSKFQIIHSTNDNETPFITPDLATCSECEAELNDKSNRRYRHPFISCINCGPRYTIINALPYDRERITMSKFPLCGGCEEEYKTPSNRRCHAQTIACNQCGPETNISIEEAAELLKNGEILAIKDIGGYHLACKCEPALAQRLREIKGRETKPFAVMFSSPDEIREYCRVSEKEEKLLLSPARPIVLLDKIKELPKGICDGTAAIGAFLPCNPIQIMLLNEVSPLIMTSANLSGEPIIIDDEEVKKFGVPILSHNREILTPLDDSVMQINAERTQFIRRARGYVPLAVDIGISADSPTLCMGGDLKSSFAIFDGCYVRPSQYFGDLEDEKYFDAYRKNIARFCALHSFQPKKIISDLHPLYYSAGIYEPDLKIQHHLAHAYSVIAEHQLKGNVLSFVFDGTGYGTDGAVWGGEVFFNQERAEHFTYVKMPASDEIAKNADLALACYDGSNKLINKAVENNINVVNYYGAGRLFDAVSAALDIKHYNSFEGECAAALEACARTAEKAYEIAPSFNPKEIIRAVKSAAAPKEEVALGFHQMLCHLILQTAEKYKVKQVALSGGCFVNKLLTEGAVALLEKNGYNVYINEKVACGDNGIALGQAYLSSRQ